LEGLFNKNPWCWLLVGFFAALAILSKFNTLFYILGLFGWCIFQKEVGRTWIAIYMDGCRDRTINIITFNLLEL